MDFLNEDSVDMEEDSLEDWESEDELDDISYVCEDCDYRWEDASSEELESGMIVCPMCGSVNVTQL